jgi:hypothetical protein
VWEHVAWVDAGEYWQVQHTTDAQSSCTKTHASGSLSTLAPLQPVSLSGATVVTPDCTCPCTVGFAFVYMESESEGNRAIRHLDRWGTQE